jgi:hypothetical protein
LFFFIGRETIGIAHLYGYVWKCLPPKWLVEYGRWWNAMKFGVPYFQTNPIWRFPKMGDRQDYGFQYQM